MWKRWFKHFTIIIDFHFLENRRRKSSLNSIYRQHSYSLCAQWFVMSSKTKTKIRKSKLILSWSMMTIRLEVFIELEFENINWSLQSSTAVYKRLFNSWNAMSKTRQKKTRTHIQNQIDVWYNKKKCVKMLNTVSIVDNYTDRLNDISDISNKLKKSFVNRGVSIIDKSFDLFSKEERKLFLNNFFDCTRSVINNNLTFQNDTACSVQQITFDTFAFFIQTSIFFTKNKNINISKKIHIDFAILITNTIISAIEYLKI